MVAYRIGYSETRSLATYKRDIQEEIKKFFEEEAKDESVSDELFSYRKDFTATLLLKIEHFHFLIF